MPSPYDDGFSVMFVRLLDASSVEVTRSAVVPSGVLNTVPPVLVSPASTQSMMLIACCAVYEPADSTTLAQISVTASGANASALMESVANLAAGVDR